MPTPIASARRTRRRGKLQLLLNEIAEEIGGDRGAMKALADLVGSQASHISAMAGGNRGVGDELAARLERARGKPPGWFDTPEDGEDSGLADLGPSTRPKNRANRAADLLSIPLMNANGSMGVGAAVPDHDEVISTMIVSRPWLASHTSFTSATNLALITGYGDSMRGTFDDGDVLIVDRGITDIRIDAVYVLELNGELYIKRLQRRPDGAVLMISDNKNYEPFLIENGDRDKFRVLGRVVMAWNARRL